MNIESLHAMKEHPGVVAVGKRNAGAREVFKDITDGLIEFYDAQNKGLVFCAREFRTGQDKYSCPVNKWDGGGEYATIKIERFNEKKGTEFVKKWDFPHAPFRYTQQAFGVYFNLANRDKDEAERNAFLEHAKRCI